MIIFWICLAKYVIKINFPCFFVSFNVATRTFTMCFPFVSHILLDNDTLFTCFEIYLDHLL